MQFVVSALSSHVMTVCDSQRSISYGVIPIACVCRVVVSLGCCRVVLAVVVLWVCEPVLCVVLVSVVLAVLDCISNEL